MAEQSVSLPLNWRELHVDELRRLVAGRGPRHLKYYAYARRKDVIKWIEENLEREPRRCPACGHVI